MKLKSSFIFWGMVAASAVATSLVNLPQARGEILYDEDIEASTRVQDRTDTREALGAAGRSQTTQPVYVQPAPSPVQIQPGTGPVQVQVTNASASAASASASEAEVEHVGKAELMRRKRMREELKNEDVLQERLEELRLRDEQARTNQILVGPAAAAASASASAGGVAVSETVIVSPPVTERAGQAAPEVLVADLRGRGGVSTAVSVEDDEEARFWIMPRGGISQMSNDTYFEVVPRYSAGITAGVEASDNLSFEAGYLFNEYGVKYGQPAGYYPGYSFENFTMRQNVFDAALKLHLLGPDARFRPFVGGGAGYSKAFVNYSPGQLNMIRMYYGPNAARDYETSAFLGTLSAGFDVRVSRRISVGALFKYNRVLSARESDTLYAGYMYAPVGMVDPNKALIGSQLSVSSFYSILAGAKFSF